MPYRTMTHGELERLAREIAAYEIWRAYANYAIDLYGPASARLEVTFGADYDGDRYATIVESVMVYDDDGQLLEPDLSTEWWQQFLGRVALDPEADDIDDEFNAAIYARQSRLPLLPRDATILVRRPPRRTIRAVYLAE